MRRSARNRPPRWAERILYWTLAPRDRDTIAGDLLEQYREAVLPARGRLRARLWYVRQVFSLMDGVTLGVALGVFFGAWNLIVSVATPLLDDTLLSLSAFYGPLFVAWGCAGASAYRRTGTVGRSVKSGALVALVSFTILTLVVMVRVNLALALMSQRSDWQALVAGYGGSEFHSFRAYVNYVYVIGAPFKLAAASAIGALCGAIGGLVSAAGTLGRRVGT